MRGMSKKDVEVAVSVLLYGGFALFVEEMNDESYELTITSGTGDEVTCRSVGDVVMFLKTYSTSA